MGLWFWQLKDPSGPIKKSRALCPVPGFLPQPNVTLNVCERDILPDSVTRFSQSINQSINQSHMMFIGHIRSYLCFFS